ncbi:MAG: alkaline phosphatase family protein [Bacteroidales bacterium]|nr:alkaline phosphatase family protein [Bacteroidales bacterium]
MKQKHLLTSLIVLMALSQMEVHSQSQKAMPRLVVSILVDQLRTDYLEAFMPLYGEEGFKRLLAQGRVYEQATYPTKRLDHASAAALFATGATAFDNGIIASTWWDRETLRPINAVDDATQQGLNTTQKSSAARLQVSTFSDELKIATEGKALVYAIAPSRETAILTAGHSANSAIWLDDVTGSWASTSYYGEFPQWAHIVNSKYSAAIGAAKVWVPTDAVVGSFSYLGAGGKKIAFKHKFEGNNRYKDYKTSGLINGDIAEATRHCLSHTTLGRDEVADYLSITFNAYTYRHASTEQVSMELQDTYVRLDAAIANVLKHIEKHIGISNTLVVLSSTGTTSQTNDQYKKYRVPTGEVDIQRISHLLNVYLMAIYGNGQYVEGVFGREIYLNHSLLNQKNLLRQEVLAKVEAFLLQLSGIKAVYTPQHISQSIGTPEGIYLRNAYNSVTSGDVWLQLRTGWKLINDSHGENYTASYTKIPFPLVFYGFNIAHERIGEVVQVDAVAPTLSKALRIRAPNACSATLLKGF